MSAEVKFLTLPEPFNAILVRFYTGHFNENLVKGKRKYLEFYLVTDVNGVNYYCEDFDTMCRLETAKDFSDVYVREVPEGRVIGFQNWPKR